MRTLTCLVFLSASIATAQQLPVIDKVDYQPLAAQASRLLEALEVLGDPLPAEETAELKQLAGAPSDRAQAVTQIQKILDRHCLVGVEINPESRVKVQEGPAKADLVEQGWRTFLVKVINQAGITPVLAAESPNAGMLAGSESYAVSRRWLDIRMFDKQPIRPRLSGLEVSTAFCSFSRTTPAGARRASRTTWGRVRRISDSQPGRSAIQRAARPGDAARPRYRQPSDHRFVLCATRKPRLSIDPSGSLGLTFQPRSIGLMATICCCRRATTRSIHCGPNIRKAQRIHVGSSLWIWYTSNLSTRKNGWYSGDHHIHAAGCAREKPQGVYGRHDALHPGRRLEGGRAE